VNVVRFESMLNGFTDAVRRFVTAAKDGSQDATATGNALFESLNWAVTLDERIAKQWEPDGKPLGWDWRDHVGHGAQIMGGVRFARNSVHHQWSDVVRLDNSGFTFPKTFPLVFFEWRWRPTGELPEPDQKPRADDRAIYQQQMEGRPVRHCLDALNGAFYYLSQLLEPDTMQRPLSDLDIDE
jgi:hypothetical protein